MSDPGTQKRSSILKGKDVRQTGLLWIVLTAIIGFVASEVQVRSMGAPASETMATTINMMRVFTWAAAPIAGLVAAMALTTLLAKRHYGDTPPDDVDHEIRNSPRVAATWIIVSALMCLFALIWGMVALQRESAGLLDSKAIQVNVVGQQWVWNFDYIDNGTVRSQDLYLPVDKPVVFHVTSKDVIHSFWIVQMGIKIDANPGYVTETSVTPNKIGVYDLRCAELCGLLHAYMQKKVHVVSQADYDAWITTNGGQI
ncbi:MAG: cytochrome c oxidase subunit II [Candidatus Nanopelagicaceae bacterium]|nr:cytochrome c oxidase subunit II [Candidatus Nanopelagicaceae bacterium]